MAFPDSWDCYRDRVELRIVSQTQRGFVAENGRGLSKGTEQKRHCRRNRSRRFNHTAAEGDGGFRRWWRRRYGPVQGKILVPIALPMISLFIIFLKIK